MTFVKYLLFIFNLIIFIAGLVLIGVGVTVQTVFKSYFAFFGSEVNSAAVFLIVIGFIVIVVSFFGCCGAYKENHCMIVTFAVLLGAVFILEVSAAIAAFLLRTDVEQLIGEHVYKSLVTYSNDESVKNAWDEAQQLLSCCGAGNLTDWLSNPAFSNTSSVPDTCCIETTPGCGKGVIKTENFANIFPDGCTSVLLGLAKDKVYIIGGVAIAVAIIQIFGVIIACCLASAIRKEYTPLQ